MTPCIPQRRERWWFRLHPLAQHVDRRVPVEWVTKRTTVSRKHHYCYFRIPKCANSSVIQTLVRHDRALSEHTREDTSLARIKSRTGGLFRATAWSPQALGRRYRCFTVVRNPFTRLLSAYLDKIAAARPGEYAYVARAAGRTNIADVSFHDFVAFLERGGLFCNAHWAPQTALLPIEPAALAFVGYQERLEEDMNHLVEVVLGLGPFEGLQSRSDRRRGADYRLTDFYQRAIAQRVARLYEADFSAFGYARELPAGDDSL